MTIRRRRLVASAVMLLVALAVLFAHPDNYQPAPSPRLQTGNQQASNGTALSALGTLAIKGRAAKTGYSRAEFGDGWATKNGCDTRNIILARDLTDTTTKDCKVLAGTLHDPYTGKTIAFVRGASTSGDVQIDHVVALSDAWQTGAAYWDSKTRIQFANDPLELLAVDGPANEQKSDGDAATWLPSNKPFRCQYIARQIAVKQNYKLWITQAEHDAMSRILAGCPNQLLPT